MTAEADNHGDIDSTSVAVSNDRAARRPGGRAVAPPSPGGSVTRIWPLRKAGRRFGGDVVDDGSEIPCLLEHPELAVGAGSLFENGVEVLDGLTGSELVHDVVDEFQDLQGELALRDLLLLSEVDELSPEAVAHRPPLVLSDELGRVLPKPQILLPELQELRAERLDDCGEADGLIDPSGRVAYPELQRRVDDVRAQIPPDLRPVRDAVGLDQQLQEVLPLAP